MVPSEGNSSTSSPPEFCPNCSLALLASVPVGKAVALGLVLVVFIVCGVLGNILVILSVACHRNLRSVTHYFIANLAVADLLLSSAVLPFSLAAELLGRWVFGRLLCSIWTVLDVLCCTASILSLCAISVDRFLAASRPLQYPMLVTRQRGVATLVLLWTLAAAISVGPLLGWREPMPEDEAVCGVNEKPSYVLFSVLGSFYVPLAVILVMYCRVYVVARRHSLARSGSIRDATTLRMHRGNVPSSSDKQDGEKGGEGVKGQEVEGTVKRAGRSSLLRLLRFSREQKAAKTLGIVVGCFILCWLPFFLVLPIGSMFPNYHPSETVFKVTFWLGYFNSCLNPIIYPCFSQEFKRAFLSVLRARCLWPPGRSSRQPRSARPSLCSTTYPPPSDTSETHTHHLTPGGAPLCPSFESPLKACCFGVRGSLTGPCPSSEGISSMPAPPPRSSAEPKTLQVSLGRLHQGQAL